jgi:hypothetical protein
MLTNNSPIKQVSIAQTPLAKELKDVNLATTPKLNTENGEINVGAAGVGSSVSLIVPPSSPPKPIEYRNGKKIEQLMYNYENYYKHKEKIPKRYYPLVQYLENVEVKYHNDNLFEDTPCGFPTRAQ